MLIINIGNENALPLDSERLPTRACIYLTKKINKLKLLIKRVKTRLNKMDVLGAR